MLMLAKRLPYKDIIFVCESDEMYLFLCYTSKAKVLTESSLLTSII